MTAETYHGNPCKRGHSGVRYVSDGACVECKALFNKAWHEKNREEVVENKRRYYQANKEHLNEQARKWRIENRDYITIYNLARHELKRDQLKVMGKY